MIGCACVGENEFSNHFLKVTIKTRSRSLLYQNQPIFSLLCMQTLVCELLMIKTVDILLIELFILFTNKKSMAIALLFLTQRE